jgi:hypothetical protein
MAVMVDNDDDNDDGNDEDNNICFVLLVASKHRQFRWPRQASRLHLVSSSSGLSSTMSCAEKASALHPAASADVAATAVFVGVAV